MNSERHKTEELLRKAKELGVRAIFVTVDAPIPGKREADERISAGNLSSPVSGAVASNDKKGGGLGRVMAKYIDSTLCWDDLAWIRRVAGLPIVLKGIQTASDARKAFEHEVEGIMLSNHGGRSLDTYAILRVLSERTTLNSSNLGPNPRYSPCWKSTKSARRSLANSRSTWMAAYCVAPMFSKLLLSEPLP